MYFQLGFIQKQLEHYWLQRNCVYFVSKTTNVQFLEISVLHKMLILIQSGKVKVSGSYVVYKKTRTSLINHKCTVLI